MMSTNAVMFITAAPDGILIKFQATAAPPRDSCAGWHRLAARFNEPNFGILTGFWPMLIFAHLGRCRHVWPRGFRTALAP